MNRDAGAPLTWDPILMYHRSVEVLGDDPVAVCSTADRLRGHLRLLARRGFAPVPLDVLLGPRQKAEGRRYAVTFDDGYAETLERALPVLRELGVPATVFAVSGQVGGTSRWNTPPADRWRLLTADQLRTWVQAGYLVGSHSHTHPRLTSLGDRELREEVAGSKARLEDLLGTEVRFFAYPHHDADERVRAAVAEAGYAGAVGGRHGTHGRYNLHRVQAEWMGDLKLALHAAGLHRRARALPLPAPVRRLATRLA